MANRKNVVTTVCELVAPVADSMGYTLWDVEFVREGARRVLRITLDKPEGINIDDCEAFHRTIDPMLDEADPIDQSYYLEVSSPGRKPSAVRLKATTPTALRSMGAKFCAVPCQRCARFTILTIKTTR